MKITPKIMEELGFSLQGSTYYQNNAPAWKPCYNVSDINKMSLGDLVKNLIKRAETRVEAEVKYNMRKALGLSV